MPDRILFAAEAPFESARYLGRLPRDHRAHRLHGHGFMARVRAAIEPGWAAFAGGEVDQLRGRLERCVAPLDYRLLNDRLEQPTDRNLAHWLHAQLDLPGIERIGIQSTPHQGTGLDQSLHARIWRRYGFEAAHRLPNVPQGHKCGRMHGHGFEVILQADAGADGGDAGVDYEHLDRCWAPIGAELHLACLNDIPGLDNPTSELIAHAIWRRLKPSLPHLARVTVCETATCGAHFDGKRYRIWTGFSLDSAVRLKRAPAGDPRRRVHGHTYCLRLHLGAPLDQVIGWTIDFGDVKQLFAPAFERLDHQPLFELADLDDNDPASLAAWIRGRVLADLPSLERIELYQTRGCGVILSWGQDPPSGAVAAG